MAALDQPPPGYTPMSSGDGGLRAVPAHHQLQFDIVPRSDATSFQAGYLGLQHEGFQAWVKGDVLLKLGGSDSQQPSGPWDKCTITLTATESAGGQSILLFTSCQQLWTAPPEPGEAASSSSAVSRAPSPPAVMPFSFELTPDLPHCIHLPTSSLVYELHARLHTLSPSAQDTTRTVPVHLTRYTSPGRLAPPTVLPASASTSSTSGSGAASSPGPSASASSSSSSSDSQRSFSAQPHVWHLHHPVPLAIRLRKSVLRRAEPIELHFRIPPPPTLLDDVQGSGEGTKTYAEKGLKLRSVEADLVRVVRVKAGQTEQSSTGGKGRDTLAPNEGAGASHDSAAGAAQELLLAHSGKLARFHSKRAIQLRLTLHPPFDRSNMPFPHPDHDAALSGPVYGRGGGGGCESISQETLLHDIRFEVRARVGLSGDRGENRDVRVSREVWIAPGAIGQGAAALGSADAGGAGSSTEAGGSAPGEKGQSSKARRTIDDAEPIDQRAEDGFEGFRSEDEYDGYEDVGRSLLDDGDDDGEGGGLRSEEQEALALQAALWPEDAMLDAISHAEASASYERLTRSDGARPAYSTEDPASQGGPTSTPAVIGADGQGTDASRHSATLERTPSHHRRRLEQLRVLLEQRERQMYRGGRGSVGGAAGVATAGAGASRGEAVDDPPPSLLESQHDLQVEVEVEGVGSAMPRSFAPPTALDAGAFHELNLGGGPGQAEDDGELPPFGSADLRGYSAREAQGGPTAGGSEDDHLPPPPISPPPSHDHHSHAHGHEDAFPPPPPLSPPPPVLAPHDEGASARSRAHDLDSADEHGGVDSGSGSRSVQPPPYIAGVLSTSSASSRGQSPLPLSYSPGGFRSATASTGPPPLPARPSERQGRSQELRPSRPPTAVDTAAGDAAPPPAYPPAYAQASAPDESGPSLRPPPPTLPPRRGGGAPLRTSSIEAARAQGGSGASAGPPRYEA